MNKNYASVLYALSEGSSRSQSLLDILDREISLPNIKMPTMGGEVCWQTLVEANGWKLQQNYFTRHARILDSNNNRIAWGTVNGMFRAMDRLVQSLTRYEHS